MQRRQFLQSGVGLVSAPGATRTATGQISSGSPFQLESVSQFGSFRQHANQNLVDPLQLMHDESFRSLKDNNLPRLNIADQQRIGPNPGTPRDADGVFMVHTVYGKVPSRRGIPACGLS